ncbi:MAG TPA: DUF134 domain-containing protein [Firmicutes bacterium]|nr:DUF134 domain-containing protein [Bacillota bacterium]
MPKPPKPRSVAFFPYVRYFKPAGVPMAELEEEVLTVEEIEALRLKDLEGLDQDTCAEKMGISQSTFQRMLASARYKLVRGLVEGRAIRIGGGNYELAGDRLRCLGCGAEWEEGGVKADKEERETQTVSCPKCGRGPVAVVLGHASQPPVTPPWRRGYGPRWR